jgi:hypothetical protein
MHRPQRQLQRSNAGSMDGSGGGFWCGSGEGAIAALCPRVGLAPYRAGNEAPRD